MAKLHESKHHLLTFVVKTMFMFYLFVATTSESNISSDDIPTATSPRLTDEWTTTEGVNSSGSVGPTRDPGSCPPSLICKNGFEADLCPETETCDCSLTGNGTRYFWGTTCDRINLAVTSHTISRTTITIAWKMDPSLKGKYYFVYRKTFSSSVDDETLSMKSAQQVNERSVRLVNLDPASADYVVCLMDQDLAGVVYATKNASRLDTSYDDCVTVSSRSTSVWSQQLAFYLICAGMALVLLVIFFVGCVKESLDKRNYHLFDTGLEHEEHEVDDVQDISSDKDDVDSTNVSDGQTTDVAMEVV